jgi:hypothetical protein
MHPLMVQDWIAQMNGLYRLIIQLDPAAGMSNTELIHYTASIRFYNDTYER